MSCYSGYRTAWWNLGEYDIYAGASQVSWSSGPTI